MFNSQELYSMSYARIYQAILNGQISLEQFEDYATEIRREAYNDGRSEGFDAGYESAQESYGDGPST